MRTMVYGLLIGIFVSFTGGGGASLYLGVLTGQIGLDPTVAVPTSLYIAVPALFFGFVTQLKMKNIDIRLGSWMIGAAVPGILFGTFVGKMIPKTIYAWLVGILLIFMGGLMVVKWWRSKLAQSQKVESHEKQKTKAIILGLLSGLMVGVGGLSGGATTISGLTLMGLPASLAAGTTTYVLWVMALIGFVSHLFTSTIDWTAGTFLMLGAIIGSVLTPLVMHRINQEKLNKYLMPFLGCLIVYFGIKMIIGM